jgi:subtilisin family serine protease
MPVDVKKLRAREKDRLSRPRAASARRSAATPPGAGEPIFLSTQEKATDTVIVKLRTRASAVRRVSTALRAAEGRIAAAAPAPFLAMLVENGFAEQIEPVFPTVVAPAASRARGALRAMAAAIEEEQPVNRARGLLTIKVDPATSAEQLAAHLNTLGDEVEYAYVPPVKYPFPARKGGASKRPARRRARQSNDPLGARQWGHGAVRIREARAKAGFIEAKGIVVAVIDSGIDARHPDLDGSLHSYVNFLPNEDERDYQGHGTHVAGIISAEINNQIGIAGVCAARIMALKALPKKGNPWNAQAYYRALAHPITGGARVVNMSLGGGIDPGERDIIADLLDAGITVVAAMGNEFEDGNPTSYPAAYDGVIAVGASDEVDRRASFSCTGKHIALVAPGERIISTTPRYRSELADNVLYDSWPGTSMATPHVAAAAALLLAKRPNLTPAQVRERLMQTADRVQWQTSRPDREYGYGRLNIEAALK